ncbi:MULTISPECIES: hypothetical protein [Turicibacter]|uniref:Conserved domain protein n=1 Tax=Turicibacter sanguinis PC909 TaxID=702450 RepID=A0ABN0A0L8_9FIRM|nr:MULTISPECIES: hypothetical protein [Turicibacter]EFF63161.1 conserved domain protein [Turicibacter sanguinis PC909]EGC92060.1 conserved domain protein [Turicibacter sp. HGF1]MDB8460236.1 hypothetical protein [Turicibacter sanguinis]MDB8543016.1 hypothetical protein [Turicibacter sanguinis]MDB8545656.1 hypothetical protein [Turicibacter sanguinis]
MSETMALLIQLAVIGVLLIPFVYLFRLTVKVLKANINKNSK